MDIEPLLQAAVKASLELPSHSEDELNKALMTAAETLITHKELILSANAIDLSKMNKDDPKYDRLRLTSERLDDMAADTLKVAKLPSPIGKILSNTIRPNGMSIRKISVPFGVIGIIYEARPNVTLDVFSLCLKSGNACVLKGGSDAHESNKAIVNLIRQALTKTGIDPHVCTLLPPEHSATAALLIAREYVDLIIPRGSGRLIRYVRDNAKVPVIETGAGIVHTYFDKEGDHIKAQAIVTNAKTRRVSVCNALDCLIMNADRLADLPFICERLAAEEVIILADSPAYQVLKGHYPSALLQPADAESYGTEFLAYKMSIKTVANLAEALSHIARYSSKHSECIISENKETLRTYQLNVDAACVYTNVSTAFTDGSQFGFGAEIGISTQKMHARGPMALPELTTYKYCIEGDGQTRN